MYPKDNWNPVIPKDNWDSTFPDRGKTGQMSGKYVCNDFDQNEINNVILLYRFYLIHFLNSVSYKYRIL